MFKIPIITRKKKKNYPEGKKKLVSASHALVKALSH